MQSSFDFAVVRVVPRVDREEFINAGVIIFCLSRGYLGSRVYLDADRTRALWPTIDIEDVRQHLEAFPRICSGDNEGGPIAKLPIRSRFHWLVAPRSAVVQVSAVHSGLCDDPAVTLDELFQKLVLI